MEYCFAFKEVKHLEHGAEIHSASEKLCKDKKEKNVSEYDIN